MTNAQTWLNQTIPINQRINFRELYIFTDNLQDDPSHLLLHRYDENKYYIPFANSLTGTLDLSTFPCLEKLVIEDQFINRLILSRCYLLKQLHADNNLLRKIIWPARLIIPESGVEWASRLRDVRLVNNNFWPQNLSEFNHFSRLESLFLGTDDRERINKGIYNRWNGSLNCIRNLRKLQELDINATDINDGLIDLPTEELFYFTLGSFGREGARVNGLKAILAQDLGIEDERIEEWAAEGTRGDINSFDNCMRKVEQIKVWQRRQRRENRQLQAQIQIDNPQTTLPRS